MEGHGAGSGIPNLRNAEGNTDRWYREEAHIRVAMQNPSMTEVYFVPREQNS